ncbi:serine/threonine-protein phosphatase 2A 56 kDa regulatory subunit beta isoform-like [Adelges cooleyi]|uniref:serine/threonine-protein phosphatase 2A 56 kDa regulatory subunit beta isoform-like n=1 Tax=Adelges cooleyi TaxID=133065 RepID=UPI0021804976|nr:serine/threonine-protein phosphatase 2A 56 kDa regulatory subunit beta isoform-like [Adelges cooleyi]
MVYYFNEDMESVETIVSVLKVCSKYFSVPTIIDDPKLKQKIAYLNNLKSVWSNNQIEDCVYPSEVYKQICVMFSENVFRSLPVSCYSGEDEINNEMMWEFHQLSPVYSVFNAFLDLKGFDPEKASQYIDKKFINASIRRLDSCVEAEREWIKHILLRLLQVAPYLRDFIYHGVVNTLAEYGYVQINEFKGVKELLEILKSYITCKLIVPAVLVKVLPPLMKRNGLVHYILTLNECFELAVRQIDANLSVAFVEYTLAHWPAAGMPLYLPWCRMLFAICQSCGEAQWTQVRQRTVQHLAQLLRNDNFVVCDATIEFCGRLVDENRLDSVQAQTVAEALAVVYTNHWNYNCVVEAGHMLKRLVDNQYLLDGPSRVKVMQVLIEERPHKMVQQMIDDTV